jgi:hypothetical protein
MGVTSVGFCFMADLLSLSVSACFVWSHANKNNERITSMVVFRIFLNQKKILHEIMQDKIIH